MRKSRITDAQTVGLIHKADRDPPDAAMAERRSIGGMTIHPLRARFGELGPDEFLSATRRCAEPELHQTRYQSPISKQISLNLSERSGAVGASCDDAPFLSLRHTSSIHSIERPLRRRRPDGDAGNALQHLRGALRIARRWRAAWGPTGLRLCPSRRIKCESIRICVQRIRASSPRRLGMTVDAVRDVRDAQ